MARLGATGAMRVRRFAGDGWRGIREGVALAGGDLLPSSDVGIVREALFDSLHPPVLPPQPGDMKFAEGAGFRPALLRHTLGSV